MRIGWIGFHMEGLLALQDLLAKGVKLEGVITLSPGAAVRRSGAADYRSLCADTSVPLYSVHDINDRTALALLRQLSLDVAFVIGWCQILRPPALNTASIGMIGAHGSLLPHNRGSAPVNWSVIRGESETGNSLIWLTDDVDGGMLIDQRRIPISAYDTCATLYRKVAETNREMIAELLPRLLSGERPGRAQPQSDEAILPRRRPKDGLIDWHHANQDVYNFVRALTRPYPGAFSQLEGVRYRIWNAALVPAWDDHRLPPGTILGPVYCPDEAACGQAVACGRGMIILLELESDNGKVLRGRELSDLPWKGKVWTDVSATCPSYRRAS